jgi:GMP reductase
MKIYNPTVPKLDFKDVLIVPTTSYIQSRRLVSLKTTYRFRHSKQQWVGTPFISSNMDSVTDLNTFKLLSKRGYLSCFPKHLNHEFAANLPDELKDTDNYMISCGINQHDVVHTIINKLQDQGTPLKFICIDVANGHLFEVIHSCSMFRDKYPYLTIVAGNVVTPDATENLILDGGADIIKLGIGSGRLCTTRKLTGVGYPQLSTILECSQVAAKLYAHVISDGGITCPGDIAKAFVAGAHFIMLGSYLAGHDESPGDIVDDHKIIYGMSSSVANKKYYGGLQNYRASEGRVVKIPIKGPINNTLQELEGGLRSACTYINSKNIPDMYVNGKFIIVNEQLERSFENYTISS